MVRLRRYDGTRALRFGVTLATLAVDSVLNQYFYILGLDL